jgi:hypothetical protein
MMAVPPAASAQPFLFQVNRADLAALFIDQLGLSFQPLSPLADLIQPPGRSLAGPALLKSMAGQAEVRLAASILADPQRRLLLRTGGSVMPGTQMAACANPSIDPQAVVVISSAQADGYQVETFPSAAEFAVWTASLLDSVPLFAALELEAQALEGAGISEYLHLIPDSLPLEAFIYLLHGIDSYRRATYCSMLDYIVNAELSLTAAEFDGSLIQSLNSRDLRWLLPTFMSLTPGLTSFKVAPEVEHLQMLLDKGLLSAGQVEGSHTLLYTWPETGRRLGAEFYRTWSGAAGLELTFSGGQTVEQVFVTPTALTNHYFTLAQPEGASAIVQHTPLNKAGLADKIAGLFSLPAPVPPATPAQQVFATLEQPLPFLPDDQLQPDSATRVASTWCLVFVSGPSPVSTIVLGKKISLGRSADNDVPILDPLVSRQHAVVELSGGGFLVTDLGSANGTFINDVPLAAPARLRVGDLVKFGGTVFRFQPLYEIS